MFSMPKNTLVDFVINEYIAFRQGNYYLTAKPSNLKIELKTSTSPLNSQLFIAEQQIDGTWLLSHFLIIY